MRNVVFEIDWWKNKNDVWKMKFWKIDNFFDVRFESEHKNENNSKNVNSNNRKKMILILKNIFKLYWNSVFFKKRKLNFYIRLLKNKWKLNWIEIPRWTNAILNHLEPRSIPFLFMKKILILFRDFIFLKKFYFENSCNIKNKKIILYP